jgi:hypothetical protein
MTLFDCDDLVVVPTVCLNPKKAKKKMKKAIKTREEQEQQQIVQLNMEPAAPVVAAAAPKIAPKISEPAPTVSKGSSLPPWRARLLNDAARVKAAPWRLRKTALDFVDQSTVAGSSDGEIDSVDSGTPRSMVESAAPPPVASLFTMKAQTGPKKSWFELTEEDDDDDFVSNLFVAK